MPDAVLYLRLSVARDESVSIARQRETGAAFALSQGWNVVGEFKDDGLSASTTRPEDRPGWQALLGAEQSYEHVIVWGIDRLARKVEDFLAANRLLEERGAALVSVKERLDMSSAVGRMVATVLATFAEYEAAQIAERVKAARDHLIRNGRVVGGTVPYGWRSVPNPHGSGLVLAQDPERIQWVRGMAEKALRGESVYSITQWLDREGAPLPETSQKSRRRDGWAYSTVERLLRNPVLAGMTPYDPGRGRHGAPDPTAVLRDDHGLPVVDPSTAIMTADERDRLLAALAGRTSPQARPRASKETTSPLLSRLATCGHCDRTMHRGTTQGRPSLSCPECGQVISTRKLIEHLEERLLAERGGLMVLESKAIQDRDAQLAALEAAIRDLSEQLTRDDADMAVLVGQIEALKVQRAAARHTAPQQNWKVTGRSVRQAWWRAEDDLERREVLAGQLASLRIVRGKVGRHLDKSRVHLEWRPTTRVAGLVEAAVPRLGTR